MTGIAPCPMRSHGAVPSTTIGQVAGAAFTSDAESRTFSWQSSTGMRSIGTLGGSDATASDINDSGQVVGWSLDGSGERRAYLWSVDGEMQDLNSLLPSRFWLVN